MKNVNLNTMYVGIIYNWKGLKEENYLYTLNEMSQFDFALLQDCIRDPYDLHMGYNIESANKTYDGILLRDKKEVIDFLEGRFNTNIEKMKELNPDTDYSDWYWENCEKNDLFGVESPTMRHVINNLDFKTGIVPNNHCPVCGSQIKYINVPDKMYECISCHNTY